MKRLLLSASLAVLVLSSANVFADSGKGKHDDHDRQGQHQKQARHHDDRRHDRDDDRRDGHYDNGRHLGWQQQSFRRGQRVPVVYLQPQYYVQDYRAYRLAPPPRGYRWVRPADDRYLLIQTTTGLISQMLGY